MTAKIDKQLAWAYIRGQKAIDAFDRREVTAQLRDFSLDRELERRRTKRLQQFSQSATEVNPGGVGTKGVPPVGSPHLQCRKGWAGKNV